MSECETCGRPAVDHAAARMRRSHARVLDVMDELVTEYEANLGYKSDYLVRKHGDRELVAEARAALAAARQVEPTDAIPGAGA